MVSKYTCLPNMVDKLQRGDIIEYSEWGVTNVCSTKVQYKISFVDEFLGYIFFYKIDSVKETSCPCGKRFLCSIGETQV